MLTLIVLGFVVLIFIIAFISMYNTIISKHNLVKRAWSDVANYERQKVNILDSLEPVVDQYTSHEASTLKDITELRQNIKSLDGKEPDVETLGQIQKQTDELIKGMSITVESYPDLKANTVYLDLMGQIKDQNENVGAAISIFNRNVEIFNSYIESFPSNIVNGMSAKKNRITEFSDSITDQNIEYKPSF
ncbi:LemA family protein [Idiomarina ramblicola]|uniref:LemA family protein n=2 Tax=Idiomarina ramblicola TaxID=263724 RepID=A0A432Z284_9GAMM|nr:LemA family protein [Idiomarina ramblicola]